jgi:hypothetical protein
VLWSKLFGALNEGSKDRASVSVFADMTCSRQGHYLLTRLLLDALGRSPEGRVVNLRYLLTFARLPSLDMES